MNTWVKDFTYGVPGKLSSPSVPLNLVYVETFISFELETFNET